MSSSQRAPSGQLADLGQRLGGLDPTWGFEIDSEPPTGDWLAPDEISSAMVEGWLAEQARELGGRRKVAATYLEWGLEHALVSICVACLLAGPSVPDPSCGNVLLKVSLVGRVEAVRFRSEGSVLVADDGASGWLAERLVRTFGPLLDTLWSRGGDRRGGEWGMVADSAAGTAVRLGRVLGLGAERAAQAWDIVQVLLTDMVEEGAAFGRRPRLYPAGDGGAGPLQMVRSTCCLYCATPPAAHGPADQRWCSTCPYTATNRRIAAGKPPNAESPVVRVIV